MPENMIYKADLVRNIDLTEVLKCTGGIEDRYDKAKWHTCRGVISVTGEKFFNWNQAVGGGGAIDLVIHLRECNFKRAVCWLFENFPSHSIQASKSTGVKSIKKRILTLPERDDKKLPQIIEWLRYDRCIPAKLIDALVRCGKLYADTRGNAVFLLPGKEKKAVGAELRGTTHSRWRGMAPGSRKDLGAFYVKGANARKTVLCESAIDAISYFALHPGHMAVSTSGATPYPAWLPIVIEKGYEIFCGFDADETGDRVADKMIKRYPMVKRLRPPAHDWNDVLKSQSNLS